MRYFRVCLLDRVFFLGYYSSGCFFLFFCDRFNIAIRVGKRDIEGGFIFGLVYCGAGVNNRNGCNGRYKIVFSLESNFICIFF